jgi:hypothetical protein
MWPKELIFQNQRSGLLGISDEIHPGNFKIYPSPQQSDIRTEMHRHFDQLITHQRGGA